MANLIAVSAVRVALTLSLTVLVSACSVSRNDATPSVIEIAPPPAATVQKRFQEDNSYSTIVQEQTTYTDSGAISPDAPERYTVVKGDTLWDISGRFMNQPWLWPEIWDYNPHIKNPHLIFPGDEIAMEYVDGKPMLVIERDGKRISRTSFEAEASRNGIDFERLSPRIRSQSLDNAIPMITSETIQSFLVHPRVIPLDELDTAPYVIGNDEGRLASAVGHQIYVRGELSRDQPQYAVFRRSKPLKDPVTQEILGYEVQQVSNVKLLRLGDPSTLQVIANKMETIKGDILLPYSDMGASYNYAPRMPKINGDGRVVSLVNAISQSGRDQVVVLNLGDDSGVKPGDILAIESRGGTIIDKRGYNGLTEVNTPNTRVGVVLVFKTFDRVSYALVMESTMPVRVNDFITGI